MQSNYLSPTAIAPLLRSLFEDLGYPLNTLDDGSYSASGDDLIALGQALSEVADKSPPWTRSYMHHALNGRQGSKRLYQAIITLGAQLDGHSPILANTDKQQVLAPPGRLHPNAVVLAESVRCAGDHCAVAFVPRVPWQRYCSAACRERQ